MQGEARQTLGSWVSSSGTSAVMALLEQEPVLLGHSPDPTVVGETLDKTSLRLPAASFESMSAGKDV